MTTCLGYNQYHLTSDLCPYCFGQPLSVAASSKVISQNSLNLAEQMLQSQILCPNFMNTEDFLIYSNGTKAGSSDSFSGSGLPISKSNPISSEILRDCFRVGISINLNNLLTIINNSNLSTTIKAIK